MRVQVSGHDQETAQKVQAALGPLCKELGNRHEQDLCRLQVAPGVVVAAFYAKDGTFAQVPVGVRALAAAVASGPETVRKYADQMVKWATRKQEHARLHRGMGLYLPA